MTGSAREGGRGGAAGHGDRARPKRTGAKRTTNGSFPIVGVGASAGGLEALADLLDHLPPDTGMAFVLIQHLSPTHKTILPEILSRHTSMPICLAENEMEVGPGHVYLIPPGVDMTIFHGRLNLMERKAVRGMHLPIDYFMRSLALDQGSRAIGIVLSGSASDGTLGLLAIKSEGGITFAQEPSSAHYASMPSSAIRANAVDRVLDPASIAAELSQLGRHPYLVADDAAVPAVSPASADGETDWMDQVFSLLRDVFGVDFSAYRASTIQRRIARRMALHRIDSVKDYVAYLRENPGEADDLYHDILIMVTEFFREADTFATLETMILPQIVKAKGSDEQVRVWVPGCATGEEPYSIALLLDEALRKADRELPVKIFATDISERDIAQARSGLFPENKLATVPDRFKHAFAPTDSSYEISKSIRDMVVFARHDVTSDPPFSQLDLVSCRNLLIYLGPPAQEQVLPVFHYALRPQGYLLLGASESIGSATDLFAPVDKKAKIFIKKPGARPAVATFSKPAGFFHENSGGGELRHLFLAERRFDPQHAAEQILLERFTPPAVVIDDDFEIMQFRGASEDYLQHASGRATLNLLAMAREGLHAALRQAVEGARRSGMPSQMERATIRPEGGPREVDLQALPLVGPAGERYYLVIFEPAGGTQAAAAAPQAVDRADAPPGQGRDEVDGLQRELDSTRDYMAALVQEKETALEELRAANEEIQSSNEELQSINEELETAKEELQSTNEELRTVNEELGHRNEQLSQANDDMSNLLKAVDMPTIMVGRDLRIRRFTPGSERVMNLISSDVGRPITDIALRLELPDLGELLAHVIEDIAVAEREVRDEHGRWYSMRIRPYQTEENRIEGAVLTLIDIDEIRSALASSAQAVRLSAGLSRALSALQTSLDPDGSLPLVLAEGCAAVDAQAGLVLLRDGGDWRVGHAHGVPDGVLDSMVSDTDVPQALIAEGTRAPITVKSADRSRVLVPEGLGASTFVVVPLHAGDSPFGVLLFAWTEHGESPDDAQADFVAKLGALLSLVLAKS